MQNPQLAIEQSLKNEQIQQVQKQVIMDLKNRVQNVVKFLEELQKKKGSNKLSRNAIKIMKKFLSCHITNPAIYKRYQEVMILMEKYANVKA